MDLPQRDEHPVKQSSEEELGATDEGQLQGFGPAANVSTAITEGVDNA